MNSFYKYMAYIFVLCFLCSCGMPRRVQSNLPKPGKQCNILLTKKYRKNKKNKKVSIKKQRSRLVKNEVLQSQLLTDEQYQQQVEMVKKSLPEFDIDNDCPDNIKRSSKKKSGLGSFFSGLFK